MWRRGELRNSWKAPYPVRLIGSWGTFRLRCRQLNHGPECNDSPTWQLWVAPSLAPKFTYSGL